MAKRKQAFPMCRKRLPPGPKQLFREEGRIYVPLSSDRVKRGEALWGSLTVAPQRKADEVVQKWVLPQWLAQCAVC